MRYLGLIPMMAALSACGPSSVHPVADLVLTNGIVVTVDPALPRAEALAASGDRIVAVGTNEEIAAYVGKGTEVIDLRGQTAIPGLIEGHGHYTSFGGSLLILDFRYAKSFSEIVSMVAESARNTPAGEWIIGRGWHQDKWQTKEDVLVEGLPTHASLSAATPEHPVMLIHTSGHGVFVNKKAMTLVELTDTTQPPEGGEIVRDSDGHATGMMREAAQDVFRQAYSGHQGRRQAGVAEAELRRMVTLGGEEALRHGITSFQDLGTTFAEVDLIRKMADEGKLPVRLYMAFEEDAKDMEGRLADYRMVGYGDNFLTVRSIGEKVLDGALGTHGGWLLEPYADMPRSHGLNVVPIEEIEASAKLAIENAYQMAIQGIGDRAYRELLNIYEAEFSRHPDKKDLRWRIEHAQVIHPDDVQRTVDLGIIPAVQGIFACSDGPWVVDRLGPERTLERGYIFNTLAEAGATPTNGTDPPVDEIDPIASFHCSVTRILPDGTKFQPQEVYSRERALYSYTMGNAIAAFEEDLKGSLATGKLADITVLSQDLLTVPDDKIRDTRIVMTIVGGKVRYRDGAIVPL
ncbi:MAG: amidohydrolase [Gammaproteobacteria bacterium]|nr:amidohydrolase [Gammaproteobacteria bacterium]MDH4313336.1 amidohydrolase [Gammaproteobacteria bacterium]MDH5214019.1 amidohydrolase [Gammaproteobacteria bacterium]MDH5499969.1 amidohydrolase [Gammaproteobacteria bacterium]